jgi:hypothetical protein
VRNSRVQCSASLLIIHLRSEIFFLLRDDELFRTVGAVGADTRKILIVLVSLLTNIPHRGELRSTYDFFLPEAHACELFQGLYFFFCATMQQSSLCHNMKTPHAFFGSINPFALDFGVLRAR